MLNQDQRTADTREEILSQAVLHKCVYFNAKPLFSIALFGKNFDGANTVNWTLPPQNSETEKRMACVLQALGANLYYAPNTSLCNAQRVPRSVLRDEIPLAEGVRMF